MASKNQTPSPASTMEKVTTSDTSANTQRIIFLILGDAIVFLVFSFIGILSHKEALDPVKVVTTAAPFMLSWFIVAPFAGAFSRKKTVEPRAMALSTILAWLPSLVLGLTFRGITVDHAVPPVSFMVVVLITNTIFLLLWRVPFTWLTEKGK